MRKSIKLAMLFGALGFFPHGCSSSNIVSPEIVSEASNNAAPVSIGQSLFDSVQAFYCSFGTWPESWEELRASLSYDSRIFSELQMVRVIEMHSPRAIALRVVFEEKNGQIVKSLFIAPPSCSGEGEPVASAGSVEMVGGRIRFVLPSALSQLSTERLKEKWNKPPRPDSAWSSDQGVVLAIRFGELDIDRDSLDVLLDTLSVAYEQAIPSIEWISRRHISSRDRLFLLHEFESDAESGRIITSVLSTSFDGKLLSITLTADADRRSDVEQHVSDLVRNIRIE
jgi:hypothetical protein